MRPRGVSRLEADHAPHHKAAAWPVAARGLEQGPRRGRLQLGLEGTDEDPGGVGDLHAYLEGLAHLHALGLEGHPVGHLGGLGVPKWWLV